MLLGQALRLRRHRRKLPILHEAQLAPADGGPRTRICRRRPHKGRNSPRIGRPLARPRLHEARSVPAVEGQRLAAIIGQTGALAGFQSGVEGRREIPTGKIHVLHHHQTLGGNQFLRRKRQRMPRDQKGKQKGEKAHVDTMTEAICPSLTCARPVLQ